MLTKVSINFNIINFGIFKPRRGYVEMRFNWSGDFFWNEFIILRNEVKMLVSCSVLMYLFIVVKVKPRGLFIYCNLGL